MYPFHIVRNDDKTYRLELDGISLIVDDFELQNEKHYIKNPKKAIAFFNVKGLLYGVANRSAGCNTAEAFYDIMLKQYSFF